jgi:vacuolar-type H+-ATPase subunit F/Vma7
MSRLLVVTRPSLVPGFQLAGVNVFGVEDIETSLEQISSWLDSGEVGLLAIDDGILEQMPAAFINRLESALQIPYLAIPGGSPLGQEISRRQRIAQTIRQAIGFHITFKGEDEGEAG